MPRKAVYDYDEAELARTLGRKQRRRRVRYRRGRPRRRQQTPLNLNSTPKALGR